MGKIRFVGDIHGKNRPYLDIVRDSPYPTVQIGDYGSGFVINPIDTLITEDKYKRHRYIRGNHDNPDKCTFQPNWIKDGTIENSIAYMGGANSIDRAYRTEGVDWWPDEQLSIYELTMILEKIRMYRPEIIISHECPEFISDVLCALRGLHKYDDDNRTRMMLQSIYHLHEDYKPKLHIFGHWHMDADLRINGTRFICLNELSYIDIDPEDVLEGEIVKYHYTHTYNYSNS